MLAWLLCNIQAIRIKKFKNPDIFVIFQGGPDPLPPIWIRACAGWSVSLIFACKVIKSFAHYSIKLTVSLSMCKLLFLNLGIYMDIVLHTILISDEC